MARLIDADALIEWINKQREQVTKKQVAGTSGSIFTIKDLVAMQRCLSTFETKIKNQPTAYDIEKVVAELEKAKKYVTIDGKSTGLEALHPIQAIDIVRKGGVE